MVPVDAETPIVEISAARHLAICRIAPRALQREQQEATHDCKIFVEVRHVAAACGSLHVPEVMGKEDDKDEVNDESIGDPASLETDQDRKPADQLDRGNQISEPCRRREATRDDVKEMLERRNPIDRD